MPNIVILGSLGRGDFNVTFPKKHPTLYNTEEGYLLATKVFYPAIESADLIVVVAEKPIIGDHTWRDLRHAVKFKKRIILVTDKEVIELAICYHCKGVGEVEFVDYPASGATIHSSTCGICQGAGVILKGSKGNKAFNEFGGIT